MSNKEYKKFLFANKVTFICVLLFFIVVIFSNITYHTSSSSNNNTDLSFVRGDTIEEQYLKFETIPGAKNELAFVGLNDTTSVMNVQKTLEIPSTIEKNGVIYQVTKIDIEFPEKLGYASIESRYTVPSYATYAQTTQYYASQITSVILPYSIKEISRGSFWGFASLMELNIPFIGLSRETSIAEEDKTIGALFSLPREHRYDGMYYTTYYNSEPQSDNLSAITPWIKSIDGTDTQSFMTPAHLTYLNVSGESYHSYDNFNVDVIPMTEIGTRACYELDSLREIVIGTPGKYVSRVNIGDAAFSLCDSLESVKLYINEVGSMGTNAFTSEEDVTNLVEVILPKSMPTLPQSIFSYCHILSNITLPARVERIEAGAFFECEALPADFVSTTNLVGLTYIGSNAFKGCSSLTKIDLGGMDPKSKIDKGAFYGCSNLEEMKLPFVGYQQGSIEYGSAQDKTEYLKNLFGWVFAATSAGAGESNVGIESDKFYVAKQSYDSSIDSAQNLLEVYIPNKLTRLTITNESYLGYGALQGLSSLTSLVLNQTIGHIETGILSGSNSLVEINIPFMGEYGSLNYSAPLGYLFGTKEYTDKTYSTENGYHIPLTLQTVVISNQSDIVTGSFANATSLKNVTIGPKTEEIYNGAFKNNTLLERLELPFVGQKNGGNAEYYDEEYYYYYYYWYSYRNIRNTIAWIFSNVSTTDTYMVNPFYSSTEFQRYIPNTLREIIITNEDYVNPYAFYNLKNVESITIHSAEYILGGAFRGCSSLVSLTVPFIGYDRNVNGSTSYRYQMGYIFGGYSYSNSYSTSINGHNWYIPNSLESITITGTDIQTIAPYAFANFSSVSSIYINSNIKIMSSYAFYSCSLLSNLDIKTKNYDEVGSYAFYNCLSISDLDMVIEEGLTTKIYSYAFAKMGISSVDLSIFNYVGDRAFSGNLGLSSVAIPDFTSKEYFGNGVFADCSYLKSATVANGMLRPYLFQNCVSLRSITPSSEYDDSIFDGYVPEGIFYGCISLTEMVIPESVTSIGKAAFYGCINIGEFILPSTLTTIGDQAFYGCSGIKDIVIPYNVVSIGQNVFTNCNKYFVIYVYRAEEDWPSGWVFNWNCDFPVYILGYEGEEIFIFEYDVENTGWRLVGIKEGYRLENVVAIPEYYRGSRVIAIDESVFEMQGRVTDVVIPKYVTTIGDSAFMNGGQVNLWINANESSLDLKYENIMNRGYVFFAGQWQMVGTTPKINTSAFEFTFDLTEMVYNGNAHEPKLESVTLNVKKVGDNVADLVFNTFDFSLEYDNNINAGSDAVAIITPRSTVKELYGEKVMNFTISPRPIYLGRENITYTYSGSAWTRSSWDPAIFGDLKDQGYRLEGTLRTNGVDVKLYMAQNLEWVNGYRIYKNNKDVTSNFVVQIGYYVDIVKALVTFVWEADGYDQETEHYQYRYIGEYIKPKAKVMYSGNDITANLQSNDLIYYYEPEIINVGSKGVVRIELGPNLMMAPDDNSNIIRIEVIMGEIVIDVQVTHTIREDEEYYAISNWNNLPSGVTITGLGQYSQINGILRTIDTDNRATGYMDKTYIYGSGLDWENGKYQIKNVNGKDETGSYNVEVTGQVDILWNDFKYKLYMQSKENPDKKVEVTIQKNGDQNIIVFPADGDNYRFLVEVTNTDGATVVYYDSNGSNVEYLDYFRSIDDYLLGYEIQKLKYNTISNKNITLRLIKSNVKVDSTYAKEYDGTPFVPDETNFIYGHDQKPIYTYYDLSMRVIDAPHMVGKYKIRITFEDGEFFNKYSQLFDLTITPRLLEVNLTGYTQLYNGKAWSRAFTTNDFPRLLPGDEFIGTLTTQDCEIGKYYSNGVTWGSLGYQITNNQSGETELRNSCYQIVYKGYVEILPLQFEYTVEEVDVVWDNEEHFITITVTKPTSGYTIMYKSPISSTWTEYNYAANAVGTYVVHYRITASHYETVESTATIIIRPRTISYSLYGDDNTEITEVSDTYSYRVEYDGDAHFIYVSNLNPSFAEVEYGYGTSLENIKMLGTDPIKIFKAGKYIYAIRITYPNYATVNIKIQFTIDDSGLPDIPVKVHDYEGEYDGQAHTISFEFTDGSTEGQYMIQYSNQFVTDEETGLVDLTEWQNQPIRYMDVGVYVIWVKMTRPGYRAYIGSATITILEPIIEKIDITDVGFENYSGEYDAEYHTVTIVGLEPYIVKYGERVKIHYYASNENITIDDIEYIKWQDEPIEYKDAGVYNIYILIEIEDSSYKPLLSEKLEIEILQTTPSVILVTTQVEYYKSAIPDEAIVCETIHDGIRKLTFYNVDATGQPIKNRPLPMNPSELGDYWVVVEYYATRNCTGVTVEGPIEIIQRRITVEYDEVVEYNGLDQWPHIYLNTHTTDEFGYKLIAKEGNFTQVEKGDQIVLQAIEVDEYLFDIEIIGLTEYYILEEETIRFEITRIKIDVTLDIEVPFNGKSYVHTDLSAWTGKILNGHTLVGDLTTNGSFRGDYYLNPEFENDPYTNKVTSNLKVVDEEGTSLEKYYEFNYDVKIAIRYAKIDADVVGWDGYYDGEQHGLSITVNSIVPVLNIFYAPADDPGNLTNKPIMYTDAGVYEVIYSISGSGYETLTGVATITIRKAKLDLVIDDKTVIYNGKYNEITKDDITINGITKVAPILSEENFMVYYFNQNNVTLAQLNNLFENFDSSNPYYNELMPYATSLGVKDAGNYYAVIYFPDHRNWEASYEIVNYTVEKRVIDVTFTSPVHYEYDYDKEYQYVGLANPNIIISETNIVDGHDYRASERLNFRLRTSSPNAGTYDDGVGDFEFDPIGIYDEEGQYVGYNYIPNVTGLTVVVNKVPLPDDEFYATEEQTLEYTGADLYPEVFKPEGSGDLKYLIWAYDVETGQKLYRVESAVGVGSYFFEITVGEGQNYYASDKKLEVILHIIPREVEVIWENLEQVYAGAALAPTAYFLDAFGNRQDLIVKFSDESYFVVNAGNYYVEAFVEDSILAKNYILYNNEEMFKVAKYKYTLKIRGNVPYSTEPWSLRLTEENINSHIIGDTFMPNHIIEDISGLLTTSGEPGDYYDGVYVSAPADANLELYDFVWRPYITVNIDGEVYDVTESFDFTFDILVTIRDKTIKYEVFDSTYTYSPGREYMLDLNVLTPTPNLYTIVYSWAEVTEEGEKFTEYSSIVPKFTDVGEYIVRFSITAAYDENQTVTGSGRVIITQADPTFKIDANLNKIYDGKYITPANLIAESIGEFNGGKFTETEKTGSSNLVFNFYYLGINEDDEGILLEDDPNDPNDDNNRYPKDVGFYAVEVTNKKDADDGEKKNYKDLNYRLVFEIKPYTIRISPQMDDIVVGAKQQYQEGEKWSYSAEISLSNFLGFENGYSIKYSVTTDNLTRGDYLLNGIHKDTKYAYNFEGTEYIFEWGIYKTVKVDESDTTSQILDENAKNNFQVEIDMRFKVRYEYMDVVSPKDIFVEYDGEAHSGEIVVNAPSQDYGYTISYSLDGKSYSEDVITRTEPGKSLVYFKVDAFEYETFKDSYYITIDKKTRIVENVERINGAVYNGEVFDRKPTITLSADTQDEFILSDVQYIYHLDDFGGVAIPESEVVDANTYYLEVIIPETEHYKELRVHEIKEFQNALTIVIGQKNLVIKGDFTHTYDGSTWQIDVSDEGFTFDELLPTDSIYGVITSKSQAAQDEPYTEEFKWVDSYTIISGAGTTNKDVTKNYRVEFNIRLKIERGEIRASVTDYEGSFDSEAHSVTAHVEYPSPSQVKISYSLDNITFRDENYAISDQGVHAVYVKFTAQNYKDLTLTGYININKIKCNAAFDDNLSKVYDGLAVFYPNVTTNSDLDPAEYYFIFEKRLADGSWAKISEGKPDSIGEEMRPKNAGYYRITLIISETNKWLGCEISQEFEISKQLVSVAYGISNFVYDGTSQTPDVIFSNNLGEDISYVKQIELVKNGDSLSVAPGEYRMTLDVTSENFTFDPDSLVKTYVINNRDITVSMKKTKDWTGEIFRFGPTEYNVSNMPEDHTFKGEIETLHSNPGSYSDFTTQFRWVDTKPLIQNSKSIVVTDYFNISYEIQVIINKGVVEVQVEDVNTVYDGKPHSINVIVIDEPNALVLYSAFEGGEYTEEAPVYIDAVTNRITYFKVVSNVPGSEQEVLYTGEGIVNIFKADSGLHFLEGFADKEYDRQLVPVPEYTYDQLDGETREYTIAVSRLNELGTYTYLGDSLAFAEDVGEYLITFTLLGNNNYNSGEIELPLTIYQRKIVFNLSQVEKVYDGDLYRIDLTSVDVENLLDGDIFSGTLATISADADVYTEENQFEWIGNDPRWKVRNGIKDISYNYSLAFNLEVTIKKALIDYEVTPYIGLYDGELHTIDLIINSPNADLCTILYGKNPDNLSPDPIYASFGTTIVWFTIEAKNYEIVKDYSKIQIDPLEGGITEVNFADKVYDGQPYPGPTFVTDSKGEQTITYYIYNGESGENILLPGAPIDAGTYLGVLHIASDNIYGDIEVEGVFKITPKVVEVTWSNTLFIYDGEEHIPTAEAYRIDDSLLPITVYNGNIKVGVYEATAESNDANYIISNDKCQYEIVKKVIEIPKFPPDQEIDYGDDVVIKDEDGNSYVVDEDGNVIDIITPDGEHNYNPDLDWGIDITGPDENGDYEWEIVPKDPDNTEVPETEGTITVNPKELDPEKDLRFEYLYEHIYTGQPIEPELRVFYVYTVINEDTNEEETLEEELFINVDFVVTYANNIDITDKAEIFVTTESEDLGKVRYKFEKTLYFKIVAEESKILDIRDDAMMKFIFMQSDYILDTRTFEVVERTEAYQEDVFFGYIAQYVFIIEYLNMLANPLERVKVFDNEGELVSEEEYETRYIGTGWSFVLYDSQGFEVDKAYVLLFGDADGDGEITIYDSENITQYLAGNMELDDIYLYASTIAGSYMPTIIDMDYMIKHMAGELVLNEEYMYWL